MELLILADCSSAVKDEDVFEVFGAIRTESYGN